MEEQTNFKILNQIDSPDDLRRLKTDQLQQVCDELRQDIVQELSVNPGHLASSLGVVELTVALHYVFNTPDDRIVWDVGHQAYGHKILTGRRDRFCTNRKLGGIRPFPSPEESPYDAFICGHASNSISAALGMAVAAARTENGELRTERYDYQKSGQTEDKESVLSDTKSNHTSQFSVLNSHLKRHVVAVIGDGAMSGGLAFEGLNNVSQSPNDILIILNDNDMSIDRSVGGMKDYLLHMSTNETYNAVRFKAARWLASKGMLSEARKQGIIRLSNALKSAISHQQNIFEGMNIRYFGPYDGHDVNELVRILRQLKDMKGPKLLHLHTKKGHGGLQAGVARTRKIRPRNGRAAKEQHRQSAAEIPGCLRRDAPRAGPTEPAHRGRHAGHADGLLDVHPHEGVARPHVRRRHRRGPRRHLLGRHGQGRAAALLQHLLGLRTAGL